jgi:hypothetical protein
MSIVTKVIFQNQDMQNVKAASEIKVIVFINQAVATVRYLDNESETFIYNIQYKVSLVL